MSKRSRLKSKYQSRLKALQAVEERIGSGHPAVVELAFKTIGAFGDYVAQEAEDIASLAEKWAKEAEAKNKELGYAAGH